MLLPVLSAILGILAFLPVNFYPAGFIFLVPLFIFFLKERKLWRLLLGMVIFRLIFLLGTAYYTLEPFLWISLILIIIGFPLSFWLIRFFVGQRLTDRTYIILFELPFLWTFFDLLQAQYSFLPSYIITAGNSLGASPFIGLASLGGLVLLTFFTALINTLLAGIFLTIYPDFFALPSGPNNSSKKFLFYQVALLSVFLILAWQISKNQLQKNSSAYSLLKNSFNLAAVSINEKFTLEQLPQLKNDLADKRLDLIVLPEDLFNESLDSNSLPADNQPFPLGSQQAFLLQNLSQELSANVLAAFDSLQKQKRYNSAVLFNSQSKIIGLHNKNRLTFAGEYWPFGHWQPPFSDWAKKTFPQFQNYVLFNPQNAYVRGDQKNLSAPIQENSLSLAAPICLEIQYPYDLKKYQQNGAQIIVNPSSNRWIDIGLNHFLYLTNNLKKIESVWLKIPIISSGIKDFAGVILPNGQSQLVDYENSLKNYGIFFGKIRY